MSDLGTPYVQKNEEGKYWDMDGFRVLRPRGTKWVSGLVAWCEAIPEADRDTLLEIGTYTGDGMEIFARYFKRVVCIDPFEGVPDIEARFKERAKHHDNVYHFRGYSTDIIPRMKGLKCVPYIDGNHRRRAVEADIKCCFDNLEYAYIGGHDYVQGSDVQIAVDRWFENVRTFEDYSWLNVV